MKKIICLVLLMIVLSGSSSTRKKVELSPNCKGEDDDKCMVKQSNKTIKNPGGGFDAHEYRTMRLPISALIEMLKDKSIFFIVNIDIDVAQGLPVHIIDRPSALYKDRLDVKWDMAANYSHDWGYLTLHLFLRNLESGDRRYLHLEVRTNRTVYKTPSEIWFPDIVPNFGAGSTTFANVNPAETTTSDELSIEITTDHGQISENETIQERGENTTTINKDDLVHQQYENILNNLSNIESMILMMKEKLIILIIIIALITGICVLVWKFTSNLYHEYKQGNNKARDDIRWRDIKWRDGKLHVYMSITKDFQGTDSPITSQEMQVFINEGPQDQELYIPPGYKLSAFSGKQGDLLKFKMIENS